MGKVKCWLLAVGAGLLLTAGAGAAEKAMPARTSADKTLEQAWEQYGFQNWDNTAKLFAQAQKDPTATDSQKLQAQIGGIFVTQYRAPGQKPDDALVAWTDLLQSPALPKGHPLRPFVMMHQAYAYIVKSEPDYDLARETYRQALAEIEDKKSTIAQEIILNYLSTYLMRYDREQVAEGLKQADAMLPLTNGSKFASTAHGMAASMALILEDYPRVVVETEAQYKAGILTRSYMEAALYRIARVNEIYLKKYDEAAKYYELLVKEVPTSTKGYYAKMRAAELRKGIIESKLFEAGSELDKDLQKSEDIEEIPMPVKRGGAEKPASDAGAAPAKTPAETSVEQR